MITFEEAQQIIESTSISKETERVNLLKALYRVLAEDVCSDIDVPPFNKSAMDGFACRKSDLNSVLEVIEEIPAGKVPLKSIGTNQCARIMTGGKIPPGADMVMQLEHSLLVKPGFVKCTKEISSSNICTVGEDIRKGELVIRSGDLILPQHIAILATAGITNPLVYSIPSIAVISTGNELVEPGQIPGESKIRNSNAWQLIAQSVKRGYNPEYLGIVQDQEDVLVKTLSSAILKYKIILISGGVSVGDYDFVPKVLKQLGVNILFHGLEAKPGKHLLFGRKDNCFIFGLPGNPVSSFVQFELIIGPFLSKQKGNSGKPKIHQLEMNEEYKRKKADTLSFIPGKFVDDNKVTSIEYHGSAHIHSYTQAQCIIEIPKGVTQINKGTRVNVRPL
jgi:molybdopterin molybdotransferase